MYVPAPCRYRVHKRVAQHVLLSTTALCTIDLFARGYPCQLARGVATGFGGRASRRGIWRWRKLAPGLAWHRRGLAVYCVPCCLSQKAVTVQSLSCRSIASLGLRLKSPTVPSCCCRKKYFCAWVRTWVAFRVPTNCAIACESRSEVRLR